MRASGSPPLRPLLVILVIVVLLAAIAGLAWFGWHHRDAIPVAAIAPGPVATAPAAAGDVRCEPRHRTRELRVLENRFFRIGYDEERRSPAWVAYDLSGPVANRGAEPNRPIFATDFRTAAHVAHRDYSSSGYDRGHLCPAYAMWSRFGAEGFTATFLMSNVIPQPHALNAGVWEDLEDDISGPGGLAERFGPLTVIDGPVFAAQPQRLRNGSAIPESCFMVVIEPRTPRALAYLVPNRADVRGPTRRYLSTIAAIEGGTGLDLLAGSAARLRPLLQDAPAPAEWLSPGGRSRAGR